MKPPISYYGGKQSSSIAPYGKGKSRDAYKLDVNNRRAATQKEKHISFVGQNSNADSSNHSDLLRPSTGETHSARTSSSFVKSDISYHNRSNAANEERKYFQGNDSEQMQKVNDELTVEELYKLHKMLKQAQNDEAIDKNSQSLINISTVIINSIGNSAIKIIYQRMWDSL